ncbi:MAG TPA: dethiobiotin synthase [bacterium]
MSGTRRARAGLFVTATDTDVGKTAVACALASWYAGRGVDVGVMKPVATGAGRPAVSDDAKRLARASGARDARRLVNPVCFREPLAPLTAARRAGRTIRLSGVLAAYAALARRHDVMVVEGIGGLLVPLTSRACVADLAARLGLPLVIVARTGLGTLNHTLLTVAEARRRRLPVLGLVFTEAARPRPADRISRRTNPGLIAEATGLPIIGCLPYHPPPPGQAAWQTWCAWAARRLDGRILERAHRNWGKGRAWEFP